MADRFADMLANVAPTLPLTIVGSELQNRPLRRSSAYLRSLRPLSVSHPMPPNHHGEPA